MAFTITCPKCCGSKRFTCYGHIAGGVCFTCSGNGTIQVNEKPAPACQSVEREVRVVKSGPYTLTYCGFGVDVDRGNEYIGRATVSDDGKGWDWSNGIARRSDVKGLIVANAQG